MSGFEVPVIKRLMQHNPLIAQDRFGLPPPGSSVYISDVQRCMSLCPITNRANFEHTVVTVYGLGIYASLTTSKKVIWGFNS